MMTSGTVVKRLVEDTSDVSVIVQQKPECHAVITSAAEGLGMLSRARDSGGQAQMRVRTAILAQERGVRCHSVIGLGRPIQMSLRWRFVVMGCWRPLCPYRHSLPSRAARWASVWSTLAALEEQILDAPAPRTAEQGKETVGEISPRTGFNSVW